MVTIRTNLREPREAARTERVELVGNIIATDVQHALQNLDSSVSAALTGRRNQRSITSGAQLPIQLTDAILNVNAVSDLTITVPLASGRNGAPLTFKNLPTSHSQTLNATGADTFDGVSTLSLSVGASLTLIPYNDGVNASYAVE